MKYKTCTLDDCSNVHQAKGFCELHYRRFLHNKNPLLVRPNARHNYVKFKPEYYAWNSMKSRCTNKNHKSYKDYGARGITVCERWKSFENFLEDMGCRPDGMTLERKDVNGNYEPGNVIWASWNAQRLNQRRNKKFLVDGITATITEHAERLGINRRTVSSRLMRKWPIDQLFIKSKHPNRRNHAL